MFKELNYQKGIAITLGELSNVSLKTGNYTNALKYGKKSLALAKELEYLMVIRDAASLLWEIHKLRGEFQKSLEMYELYTISKDSIESEANQKEIIRQEYKYEYERKALEDSISAAKEAKLKDAELAKEKAESKRQKAELEIRRNQQYALFGGLALVLVFALFIFNRFRVTKKQKKVIENQKTEVEQQKAVAEERKELVEEKNKEILDSISYAKRLQEAILPPTTLVKKHLEQSFILYKPKDIIAGDFYWLETVEDTVYFAAADCT